MPYYDDDLTLFGLVRAVFCAASVTCFLWAMHRIGRGTVLTSQLRAYEQLADTYTPEERELLIHRMKVNSLRRV